MDQLMAKVEEPTALTNPPEAVMDRIHFVVNNVTANNLPQKVSRSAIVSFPRQATENEVHDAAAERVARGLFCNMCRTLPAVRLESSIKFEWCYRRSLFYLMLSSRIAEPVFGSLFPPRISEAVVMTCGIVVRWHRPSCYDRKVIADDSIHLNCIHVC